MKRKHGSEIEPLLKSEIAIWPTKVRHEKKENEKTNREGKPAPTTVFGPERQLQQRLVEFH